MNNKLSRQKHHERFLLEHFISESKFDAQIIEDRESPDFIVCIDGLHVGVEVTEIFIKDGKTSKALQAREAISAQIVAKAKAHYLKASGVPAHVKLGFSPGHDLRKLNRDKTSQALCKFILAMNLSTWQRVNWNLSNLNDDEESPLPEEISFVHALGVPKEDMAHWGVVMAGFVASLSPETLQTRIDAKAKKLSDYKNVVQDNWLLIVANALNPSSSIEAKPDFNPSAISSPFNRTFFFRYPDSFFELGARNPYLKTHKANEK